jgi:hypothetical protein
MILVIPPPLDSLPAVRIRTRGRNMLLPGEDGQLRHTPVGSEIVIERHALARLDPCYFEIVGTVAPPISDHGDM